MTLLPTMSSKKIDIINIGLIFLSLLLAFWLPFQLFLFSYAVLGPLHYLTEINWLKEKNYFIPDQRWIWVFVVIAVLLVIPTVVKLPLFSSAVQFPAVEFIAGFAASLHNKLLLICLLFGITLVYLKKAEHTWLYLFVSILVAMLLLRYVSFAMIMLSMFLPTIIHVYLFTLLFMVFGTMQTKNMEGWIAVACLAFCPLIIIFSTVDASSHKLSAFVADTFIATGFNRINTYMAKGFGEISNSRQISLSVIGIKVQVFVAFCYTYYYLNWFSKTSVIGWHRKVSKVKIAAILIA